MFTKAFPSLVAIVDKSGIPMLTVPDSDQSIIVGSLISIAMSMSEVIKSGDIDYILVENGVMFVKPIGEKGYLLMFFKEIKNPADIAWVADLFLNSVREKIRNFVDGFITDRDVGEVTKTYDCLSRKLEEMYDYLGKIDEVIQQSKKIRRKVRDILAKCSAGLILYDDNNNKISISHTMIKNRGIDIDVFLKILKGCLRKMKF